MERSSSSEDELDKLTRSFEQQASEDLRSAAQKRETAKSKVSKPKGMKEIREEGLQAPVPEQSKGFKMLSQMGYQKGVGLGKNQTGIAEPIDLLVKEKRSGLGMEEERKRRREEREKTQAVRDLKRQQVGTMMQKDFAQQQSEKLTDRKAEGQLRNARKVIETLDRRKDLEPSFLWPQPEKSDAEEVPDPEDGYKVEETEPEAKEPTWEDQPVREKLITALSYLRNHHFYCLYCGVQYEDEGALKQQCPGMMEEEH